MERMNREYFEEEYPIDKIFKVILKDEDTIGNKETWDLYNEDSSMIYTVIMECILVDNINNISEFKRITLFDFESGEY